MHAQAAHMLGICAICVAVLVSHTCCGSSVLYSRQCSGQIRYYRPHYERAQLLVCDIALGFSQSAFVMAFLPALAGAANIRACQIRGDHFAHFATQVAYNCTEYSAHV